MALGHGDPALQSFDLRKGRVSFALWLVLTDMALGPSFAFAPGPEDHPRSRKPRTEETLRGSLRSEILI